MEECPDALKKRGRGNDGAWAISYPLVITGPQRPSRAGERKRAASANPLKAAPDLRFAQRRGGEANGCRCETR